MIVSYKNNIFDQSSAHKKLFDIINDIASDKYQKSIDDIRGTDDKEERDRLKKQLPCFFPSMLLDEGMNSFNKSLNVSSTGIVQFDIDEYDKDKSLKIIAQLNKNQHVIYSFLSPSNGIKFGVMTDFICSDKSTIVKKYHHAYEIIKDEFLDILTSSKAIDSSVSSISQQCYLSYDPGAYFNGSAKKIIINDSINKKYQDEIAKEQITQKNYIFAFDESDNDVLACLELFPHYLPYEKRLAINFSIIDHFKSGAKPILLNHWSGVEDQSKLSKDIDDQIKGSNGKITISTLFHLAKEYGYEYEPKSNITETTLRPTYDVDKYLSVDECSQRLEEIILNDFFEQKKNKAVLVESGSGKTRMMLKTVTKYQLKHGRKLVEIFVKTHEMMDQLLIDMINDINQYNDDLKKELGPFEAMLQGVSSFQKPTKITGRGVLCTEHDKDVINNAGATLCEGCVRYSIGDCPYYTQFSHSLNSVRIYTHNRLFVKPDADQRFYPSHIIVDEDIVSMMTNTDDTILSMKEGKYQSITKILANIREGKTLIESTFDVLDQLKEDKKSIQKEIVITNGKINHTKIQRRPKLNEINNYKQLLSQRERQDKLIKMITELMHLSLGNKLQSKNLWVQYRNGIPELVYGKAKNILSEYQNKPMLYLDGSGEEAVIESLLKKDFEFEHLRVEQQPNAKVYQFTNNASFSKSSFSHNPKIIDQICNWVDTIETERLGLVRYKRINGDCNFFQNLDDKINEINDGESRIGYFGDIRGLNRFEDCDTLLIVGQHRLPDYAIFSLSQLIFREEIIDDESRVQSATYDEYIKRDEVDKIYRMKSGRHKRVKQTDYVTNSCRLTSSHFDKSETYQALHRLRLIHGNEKKNVFILTDAVLDVSVDELLDRYKGFKDKNIQVIKYIKENKFLIDSNDSFSEVFGWNTAESKGLRRSDDKGSGEWFKSHRSLKYWMYKTTNRRSGKLYSWHNQSTDDVKNWLESQNSVVFKILCHSSKLYKKGMTYYDRNRI